MLRIAGALLALSLAAGCSGSGDPQTTTTREPVEDTTGQVGPDPEATPATTYGVAYDFCTDAGAANLATEVGGDASDVASVADAYALGTNEQYRPDARSGCLDGLTRAKPRDPA